MAAGYRSLLAFWAGGAGAAASPAAQAGVRSLLAPWAGGASAEPAPADQAGTRSLLAFWLGGASAGAAAPPQPPAVGGGSYFPLPRPLVDALRSRRIEEDDLLLLLAACLQGKPH